MRSSDVMKAASEKEDTSFNPCKPMDSRHWSMIGGGVLLGAIGSFCELLPVEVRLILWVVGMFLVYYSGSWPATAKALVKHRMRATIAGIIASIMVLVVQTTSFTGGADEWLPLFERATGCAAMIVFIVFASRILGSMSTIRVSALHHAIVTFEGHDVRMLVEEGDPIFARSGFSVDEQSNEVLQDEAEAQVEVGGTIGVTVKFFTETEIARDRFGDDGQVHWVLGPKAASHGFLNAGRVALRRIAAEAFPGDPGGIKAFKKAADGPVTLWVKWILAGDKDPREDAELVKTLGWKIVDSHGHVPMESGIEFFRKHADELEELLVHHSGSGVAKVEREFGRDFVGEMFGITDVIAPDAVEEAMSTGEELAAINDALADVPNDRLEILGAMAGKLDLKIIRGLEGSNAHYVEGVGGGGAVFTGGKKSDGGGHHGHKNKKDGGAHGASKKGGGH